MSEELDLLREQLNNSIESLSRDRKLDILYEAHDQLLQAIEHVQIDHGTAVDDSNYYLVCARANLGKLFPDELPMIFRGKE